MSRVHLVRRTATLSIALAVLASLPAIASSRRAVAAAPATYVTQRSVTIAAGRWGDTAPFHAGVAVYDRVTRKYFAAGDYRGAFASESVVKVFIATRLLIDGRMHGTTAKMAYKMITQSDDAMANALYGGVGGDSLIDWVKRRYDQTNLGSRPTHPGWWGNTHITALGLVELYAKLAHDRRVAPWLLNAMHHAHRYGSDGTYQFYGIPSATTGAAIKQGWGCDLGAGCNEADFNSTGFVNGDRYTVAILVRGPLSSYGSRIDAVLTGIARRLLPHGTFPYPAAAVLTLSSHRGPLSGGRVLTLHGTNFRTVRAVYVGGTKATAVKVISPYWIHTTVPARSRPGTVAVQVMTSSGLSPAHAAVQFQYIAAPSVTSVSPASGTTKGGTTVTVDGTDFTDVTGVSFGSASAKKLHVLSSRSLRVSAPPHAPGAVDVVVRTKYGTSKASVRFTYAASPAVAGLSRTSGGTAGGELVTVSGRHFAHVTDVQFGSSVVRTVRTLASGAVQVRAPKHAAGVVDVRVSTVSGRSSITARDRYRYLGAAQPVPTQPAAP